jgi:hypothetical protein
VTHDVLLCCFCSTPVEVPRMLVVPVQDTGWPLPAVLLVPCCAGCEGDGGRAEAHRERVRAWVGRGAGRREKR